MKIEQQVTSLEISKRLKELGVKQESLFLWFAFTPDQGEVYYRLGYLEKHSAQNELDVSAFTVAELFELIGKNVVETYPNAGTWQVGYNGVGLEFQADTLSDALGKLLIKIYEENKK